MAANSTIEALNVRRNVINEALRRSIPARAGEPRAVVGNVPRHEVYPRACGGTSVSGGP